MKHLRWLVCGMLSLTVSAVAQEVKDIQESPEQLRKELKEKENRIQKLEIQNQELETKVAEFQRQLKELKENERVKGLKQQIERLRMDSLEWVSRFRQQQEDYGQRLQADSSELVTLREELLHLRDYKRRWLAELAASAGSLWAEMPYRDIPLVSLRKELEKYEEFAGEDSLVADARDRLVRLQDDAMLVQLGFRLVNEPYDPVAVDSIRPPMKELRNRLSDGTPRRKEVASLFWLLDNYRETVQIFQELIGLVDECIRNQEDNPGTLVEKKLEKLEKEDGYVSALQDFPWIKEQFEAYRNYYVNYEPGCGDNKARTLIMNLKP